jgi:acetyltransferase-like isoleucine patch superfamily enzyme
MATFIHATADVHASAVVGDNAKIWNWVQVRERARVGKNTILSKGVYVDQDVVIGDDCKIQNNVSVYQGVTLERGVFCGPHVCFTNDKLPRALTAGGAQKGAGDWQVTPIVVREGASIGANATILPGVTLGRFCFVGGGAVVTRDVPDHALVVGNPARRVGTVCRCGKRAAGARCATCGFES